MLINNPEALKSWLVIVLEPLCDADSSALARYVLALLKKDKPEKELKRVMIEQLDVFLGEETKPFVERLFTAIGTEEYLSPSALAASAASEAAKLAAAAAAASLEGDAAAEFECAGDILQLGATTTELKLLTDVPSSGSSTSGGGADKLQMPAAVDLPLSLPKTKDIQTNSSSSGHKSSNDAAATSSSSSVAASAYHHNAFKSSEASSTAAAGNHLRRSASPLAAASTTVASVARTTTTAAAADKENQPRESRRRRASLRSRSRSPRSRSRSNERLSRRSRSRDRRANEREKNQRQFRNKSPPPPPTYSDGGANVRHERRRGGGGGGLDRRRIGGGGGLNLGVDERSPRFGNNDIGGGGRKRTHRSNSRSRSPSLERRERNKNSPRRGGGGSPADRHAHSHAPQQQQQQQQQIQHHDTDKRQRCRDFDEKGYCVRGETCPWDHGINPVVFEGINNTALISMSLREYNPDAPDLWARAGAPGSQQAPGGGGINPFSGAVRPGGGGGGPGLNFGLEKGANGAGSAADYARAAGFRGAAPIMPFPFNPAAVATPLQRELIPIPVVDASGGVHHNAVGGDIGAATLLQQHGGAVSGKRRYEMEDAVAIADGPPAAVGGGPMPMPNLKRKQAPLNSRLGPPHRMQSLQMQQQQQSNCSLELRKVPRGLNTIAHLNNHFAKFGKIVNIQISYDGDPEAAICTFSTHAEANVAYRSTEAVLNNRFIKVFWHATLDGESSQNNAASLSNSGAALGGGGGRKNSQYHLNNVPAALPTPSADNAKTANISTSSSVTSPTSQTSASPPNNVAVDGGTAAAQTSLVVTASHLTQPSLRLKNNVVGSGGGGVGVVTAASNANIRKNQQEKAKAVVQLANGLRKRKQELLQSYVKQMKSALELVERSDSVEPQRAHTLATIKILQATIDKLRKEIAAEQAEMQSHIQSQLQAAAAAHGGGPPPAKKTKEQQKRELLDIELELFAQQQEGNDTSAIQRRLEELQRSLGIVPGTAAPAGGLTASSGPKSLHHRGGVMPAPGARPTFPDTGSTRVDRRPKAIVVTGFTGEEADFVLGHFKHFGEITKHDVDKEIPQLILSYATRINAEQAVLRGKLFKDKRLQISWAPVIAQPAPAGAAAALLAQNKANTLLAEQNSVTAAANEDAAAKLAATGVETTSTAGGIEDKQHRISESEAMTTNDTLPELRLEDEEEDEESEDRSWRR